MWGLERKDSVKRGLIFLVFLGTLLEPRTGIPNSTQTADIPHLIYDPICSLSRPPMALRITIPFLFNRPRSNQELERELTSEGHNDYIMHVIFDLLRTIVYYPRGVA